MAEKTKPYELVVLGGAGVGKTALITQLVLNKFVENVRILYLPHICCANLPVRANYPRYVPEAIYDRRRVVHGGSD